LASRTIRNINKKLVS
jgi:hypothetical protein